MTTVDKLVYLIRKGKVSPERVAPQYREQVAAELGAESSTEEDKDPITADATQNRKEGT